MTDEALASIIVAAIAAISAMSSAWITVRQGKKVDETHKQVTVNHHSSDFPTVLDRIDDVRGIVLGQGAQINTLSRDFNEHVSESINMRERVARIEGSHEQTNSGGTSK